jgi:hypothetical protein
MTMSKNAMAGAVTLCGVGLCMIGGAMMMQNGQQAHAAGVPAAAAMVASTANAQAGPTVVWYSASAPRYYREERVDPSKGFDLQYLYRAWSDGTVEYRTVRRQVETWVAGCDSCSYNLQASHYCEDVGQCLSPWIVCASPNEGFKAAADIDGDQFVDGVDLASVLGNWGDAPRVPFPPSDCPLNLINP